MKMCTSWPRITIIETRSGIKNSEMPSLGWKKHIRCPVNCPIGQSLPWGFSWNLLICLVSRLGLEPRALALKGRCSTD